MAESEQKNSIDYEQLAILIQRRYNALKDFKAATDGLQEALNRDDGVTAELYLNMRQEHLEKIDMTWQDILLMGEDSQEAGDVIKRLMLREPEEVSPENDWERKILDMRLHARILIDQIKQQDRMVNLRVNKERSFYHQNEEQ